MTDVNGSVVIVTGASSGIGAALARQASRQGANVVLAARRKDRLERVAADCPGRTLVAAADLTSASERNALVDLTLSEFGRIDILINNAGLGWYGDFMTAGEDDWRKLFDINLFGPALLTRQVVAAMLERGRGLVVNVASIGGLIAHADRVTPYVSSKHAMVGFSRGLARDLAGTGIRVLAACPHLTDTEFFAVSPGADEMAAIVTKYKSFMDTPDDVARGILAQLDSERLVVFPTDKPAKAFARQRDI